MNLIIQYINNSLYLTRNRCSDIMWSENIFLSAQLKENCEFEEYRMFKVMYQGIFSRQIEAIVFPFFQVIISNTSDSVSSGYQNTEKIVENTTRSGVFLTKFEVFG